MNDDGDMVYDFSDATIDDWYCVEEYVTEQSYRRAAGGEQVPVDKLKIKTTARDRALRLIGDLAPVAAFVPDENAGQEAQPLNITFNVAEPVGDVRVTKGES